MTVYAQVFLAFLAGLMRCDPTADAYLFHTRLVRITEALANLAPQFHWSVTRETGTPPPHLRAIVVATQGEGDQAALRMALEAGAQHVAFVGSGRKFGNLAAKLEASGVAGSRLEAVSAPAGLDIGAVTPEEIALSILAELVRVRRRLRGAAPGG